MLNLGSVVSGSVIAGTIAPKTKEWTVDGHGIRQYMRNITNSRQILTFYVDMF